MSRPIPRSGPRLAAAALTLVMTLAACSSGSSPAPSSAATAAASAGATAAASAAGGSAVTIQNFAFNPASLTVAVGSTVTWTNQDDTGHTVTADDGSFDSKTIANGAPFSQAFSSAGTFAYHCSIHTSMKGTIVVQ